MSQNQFYAEKVMRVAATIHAKSRETIERQSLEIELLRRQLADVQFQLKKYIQKPFSVHLQ